MSNLSISGEAILKALTNLKGSATLRQIVANIAKKVCVEPEEIKKAVENKLKRGVRHGYLTLRDGKYSSPFVDKEKDSSSSGETDSSDSEDAAPREKRVKTASGESKNAPRRHAVGTAAKHKKESGDNTSGDGTRGTKKTGMGASKMVATPQKKHHKSACGKTKAKFSKAVSGKPKTKNRHLHNTAYRKLKAKVAKFRRPVSGKPNTKNRHLHNTAYRKIKAKVAKFRRAVSDKPKTKNGHRRKPASGKTKAKPCGRGTITSAKGKKKPVDSAEHPNCFTGGDGTEKEENVCSTSGGGTQRPTGFVKRLKRLFDFANK